MSSPNAILFTMMTISLQFKAVAETTEKTTTSTDVNRLLDLLDTADQQTRAMEGLMIGFIIIPTIMLCCCCFMLCCIRSRSSSALEIKRLREEGQARLAIISD